MSAFSFEGIHHVSIDVTDLERAKRFYGEVLGLRESAERPAFDFPGGWYEIGAMQIHLIVCPNSRTLRNSNKIETMEGHFALRVSEIGALKERLERFEVPLLDIPDSITGWHQLFVADPDGNIIEFNAVKAV